METIRKKSLFIALTPTRSSSERQYLLTNDRK
jgi:hypothetical protein